ncbi:unnamed protein product [Adineta steineri]|uniref:OTU domain-containing protein n=1 Tax=Adineta steineri TaxID=433720 RepID=A0A814BJ73_9BILA|nr:unnamed protein product [Adineta steineri]CAF3792031.1 unnamed protein product [Adineta steineri]
MLETTNVSGTLTRTTRQSDTIHPHYFNSFQNYCSGPKSKTSSSSNKDFLPIPEKYKLQSDEILQIINRHLVEHLPNLTQYTSVLPHEFFDPDHSQDFQRCLVDRAMFKMMAETRVINWMPSLKKLYPVRTSGNGNCLLHAVLIAMAGVHDFNLNLRDRLRQFMNENNAILKASWKTERLKNDRMYGIQSEESKLNTEWEELCDLVRYENPDDGQTASNLQFLEGVHIFSISNMLARPIIILSEDVVRNKHGEAISVNDLFGIYLPVLTRPQDCIPAPIVLAYDQSHFCPLQTSDKDTGASSDNFLPLYQSIEHIQKQTLLPIRFLGNDGSKDEINKLLQNYLRMKSLSHYPDTKSAPISIRCVELGNKHFNDNSNYFLVYYNYLMDFYETQKRKLQQQEEEEEDDRRRYNQNNYFSNQSSSDTNQRLTKKTDILSSSPPPPYSSLITRTNDDRKSNPIYERRSSYDKAITNETPYITYNENRRPLNQHSESQNHIPRYTLANDNYNKQNVTNFSNWDSNYEERGSNGKIISNIPTLTTTTLTTNSRGNDSRFKQDSSRQQKSIPIPVHFEKSDSPSNLIDFDQETGKIQPCFMCKHLFKDLSSTKLCPDCSHNMKYGTSSSYNPYHNTTVRFPARNMNSTTQRSSDFLTPLQQPLPRTIASRNILCLRCKHPNVINNEQLRTNIMCSVCRNYL